MPSSWWAILGWPLEPSVVVLGGLGRVVVDRRIDLPRPRNADELQVDPTYVSLHREMAGALQGAAA